MAADLHCHTQSSDGSDTAEEVVLMAKMRGLSAVAVTDHDTFAGSAKAVGFGKKYGIPVVPGAEFSCIDAETGRKAHILCYCCDAPEKLEPVCRRMQNTRRKAGKAMLEKVRSIYPVPAEMVMKYVRRSTCFFKQHIMHALIDAGYAGEIYGPVYKKLFSSSGGAAYVKIDYPEVHDVIEQIRRAGGIAVLAHPAEFDSYGLLDSLSASKMIDGVEVWHPSTGKDAVSRLSEAAAEYGLVMTGGTDFHGMYTKIPHPVGSFTTPDEQLGKLLMEKHNWRKT